MGIERALTLFDLVLHEVIDPKTHLDIVLEHHHDHTVERESQIILLNGEALELFLEHAQLLVTLCDQVEGAATCIVLLRHCREARLPDVLELAIERLNHLLDVVRVPMHVLIGEESTSLQHDFLIHMHILHDLLVLFFGLVQADVNIELLLFSLSQKFVYVRFKSIVSHLNFMLSLFIFCVFNTQILIHVFLQQILLFLLNFLQLGLKCLNRLFEVLLLLLQFLLGLFCLFALLLSSLDQHIDILHDLIL